MDTIRTPRGADTLFGSSAPLEDAAIAEAAIINERRKDTANARATPFDGVRLVTIYAGARVLHRMFLLERSACDWLHFNRTALVPWSPRLVAMCGAQLWLVVPLESFSDAQAHLSRHGLDPRVGGYGRDGVGAMRLEWW